MTIKNFNLIQKNPRLLAQAAALSHAAFAASLKSNQERYGVVLFYPTIHLFQRWLTCQITHDVLVGKLDPGIATSEYVAKPRLPFAVWTMRCICDPFFYVLRNRLRKYMPEVETITCSQIRGYALALDDETNAGLWELCGLSHEASVWQSLMVLNWIKQEHQFLYDELLGDRNPLGLSTQQIPRADVGQVGVSFTAEDEVLEQRYGVNAYSAWFKECTARQNAYRDVHGVDCVLGMPASFDLRPTASKSFSRYLSSDKYEVVRCKRAIQDNLVMARVATSHLIEKEGQVPGLSAWMYRHKRPLPFRIANFVAKHEQDARMIWERIRSSSDPAAVQKYYQSDLDQLQDFTPEFVEKLLNGLHAPLVAGYEKNPYAEDESIYDSRGWEWQMIPHR